MNTNRKCRLTIGGCTALLLAMTIWTTGCGGGDPSLPETGSVTEAETEGLPALTDDRTLTDLSPYVARLDSAFGDTEAVPPEELTYTIGEDGVTLTGYTGTAEDVVIPAEIDGLPVVAVAADCFRDKSFRSLCLPDGIRRIAPNALIGCDRLQLLRLPVCTAEGQAWFGGLFGATSYTGNTRAVPSTLSTLILSGGGDIPAYCFYGCTGLEVVEPASDTEQIGDFAFYGCAALAYLSLPETLTSVGTYALANCTSLIRMEVPSRVRSLGGHLLEGCGRLESLTLPFPGGSADGENSYLGYLFGAEHYTLSEGFLPSALMRVELSEGITSVPANAFYECSRLREVVLPATVTNIQHRAFYRCAYLTEITLPANLTALGDEAFAGCSRLPQVDLSMLTSTEGWGIQTFRGCLGLAEVTLAEGITALPSGSFEGCSSLERLTGATELRIDQTAFRGCPLLTRAEESQTQNGD